MVEGGLPAVHPRPPAPPRRAGRRGQRGQPGSKVVGQKVKDLGLLRNTVARWAAQTKHRFSAEEIESVVVYLNRSHYRFELSPDIPRRGR